MTLIFDINNEQDQYQLGLGGYVLMLALMLIGVIQESWLFIGGGIVSGSMSVVLFYTQKQAFQTGPDGIGLKKRFTACYGGLWDAFTAETRNLYCQSPIWFKPLAVLALPYGVFMVSMAALLPIPALYVLGSSGEGAWLTREEFAADLYPGGVEESAQTEGDC